MGKLEVAATAAALAGAAVYAKRRGTGESPTASPTTSPSKELTKRLHRLSESHGSHEQRRPRDHGRQLFGAASGAQAGVAPARREARRRSVLGTLLALLGLAVGLCACVASVRVRLCGMHAPTTGCRDASCIRERRGNSHN